MSSIRSVVSLEKKHKFCPFKNMCFMPVIFFSNGEKLKFLLKKGNKIYQDLNVQNI